MRISEIFSSRITHWKLEVNNYLQQKWIIKIYVADCGKASHLLTDPPTPGTNVWTLEDNNLLYQILTPIEPKIQDSILHCVTVKELL